MRSELNSFPPEFIKKVLRMVPPGLVSEVWKGFLSVKPTTFRINSLKATPDQVIKDLENRGLKVEPVFQIPLAFELKKGSNKKLVSSKSFLEGWIYLQSLSSQLPALVLDPKPGERILDLAAAPGGKTTQIASLMNNQGEIIAIEPHRLRFEKLQFNLNRQGVTIAQAIQIKGEKFCLGQDLLFDRILLDAPCSSEGTFYVKEPQGFRHWSKEFIAKMAFQQKKLLKAALSVLKAGGRLVYSTCALSQEENEVIIDNTLKEHPDLIIEDIPLKFPFLRPALFGCQGMARRIYPSPTLEGFFICRIRKNFHDFSR